MEDLGSILRELGEKVPGCEFVSLVGKDGLTVFSHVVETKHDPGLVDAEVANIFNACRMAATGIGIKRQIELIWVTESNFFVIYPIGEDFFLYMMLGVERSNPGLARVELRRASKRVAEIISS
ncbi:hypothetical protein DRP53_08860 [candidate division WOR-3 bacterium]|uniref:Roadblock/LAMTOR2 domain-containing protein n=1 Tax=candidate division WOR-3 bacterium TaxID=2052148 RepID=A0A660SGW6_UNCW3|nr:MAG: hypothetical protein DRP53_08860 [candidate division WOR-3 bacterium]